MSNTVRSIGIGCLVILAVLFCGGCTLFNIYNGIRSQAINMETKLTARFSANQTTLDALVVGVKEQVNLQFLAGDQMDQILRDALQGRYGEDGFDTSSALFLAVQEAYPEAGLQELVVNWGKIQNYIQDGRATFKNDQQVLIDQVRQYNNWREEDLIRKIVLGFVGVPTENLVAQVGNTKYTRQDALDVMSRLVLSGETQGAFQTGTYDGVLPQRPGTPVPTPEQ